MNSQVNILWKPPLVALILQFLFTSGKLLGDNICYTQKIYLVNVTEYYTRNVTERNYQWCYNVPPRCSFYITRNINDTRMVEKNQTRTEENCCPGSIQIGDRCVPACSKCDQGICEDGACVCFSGFKGTTCQEACDVGEWGPNCSRKCDCTGRCDAIFRCRNWIIVTNHSPPTDKDFPPAPISTDTPQTTISGYGETSGAVETFLEQPKPHRESSTEPMGAPKMEPSRELIQEPFKRSDAKFGEGYSIPVDIMFGDQGVSQATTTDEVPAFTFVSRIVTPYKHNFNPGLLETYLKLVIPLVALVVLIALILGIYYVSRMGDKRKRKGKGTVVKTNSILDEPLPDPPTNGEAMALTSCEYKIPHTKGAPTFETRITHNSQQISEQPQRNSREIIYDQPRSTRGYRADLTDRTTEPVYDEVIIENMFLYIH